MRNLSIIVVLGLLACDGRSVSGGGAGGGPAPGADATVDASGDAQADAPSVDDAAADTSSFRDDADADADAVADTEGGDAADSADAAGFPCGPATCLDGQICVQDLCGGGPAQCVAAGDGGSCAPGWQFRASCPATGGPGCDPPPCANPPPRCADLPAACQGGLSCPCIGQSSVCGGLSCASASGRNASCSAE